MNLEPLNLPHAEGFPPILAGPCSAETEEQVMATAAALAALGFSIFRAGVWKPRTKPGGFEGVGEAALPWLQRVKRETGMLVAIEVATPDHVKAARQYGIDIFWIGARTTANPFAVQALADCMGETDIPVLVKNPLSPDIELWIGALQRLNRAGVKRLAAINRGFSIYGPHLYRNLPMWQVSVELRRRYPQLPVFCDPSHIAGRADLIESLCQQALDMAFDGLIIESHCRPGEAWSDAEQQVTPERLHRILSRVEVRNGGVLPEGIVELRRQIDEIDARIVEILAERMTVSRKIGAWKKTHNMTVLQSRRYNEILDRREAQALQKDMNAMFVKKVFACIHEESVRQQIEIMKPHAKDGIEA